MDVEHAHTAGPGRRLHAALAVAVAAALLLWAAAFNGHPFVQPDTGTYVQSSFTLRIPSDRPVFYGLFLAATHAGRTLWAPVVAQAVLVAVTLALVVRVATPAAGPATTVLVAAVLAAATSLPWFVGQISPDVFAGLTVLSFYLVVTGRDRLGRPARVFAFASLVVAAMVHSSHLLLVGALAACVQAARRVPALGTPRAARRRAWAALATAIVLTMFGNLVLAGKPVLGRGSHAFLLGRLIEDGVLARVLDEQCATTPYRLCAFRAELPTTADGYLWPADGLLARTGGWSGSKAESWRLILTAVATHPLEIAAGSLASSARQLLRFRTGDALAASAAESWVETVLAARFPGEHARYTQARQRQGTLPLAALAAWHQAVSLVAAGALAVAVIGRGPGGPAPALAALVVVALVANAVVSGALSGVHDRYQARLVWLVVLAALLAPHPRRDSRPPLRAPLQPDARAGTNPTLDQEGCA